MSAAHTPGPWEFRQSDGRYTIYANGDSIMGDETYYPWCPSNKADWHLIAAAPDLLEALQVITLACCIDDQNGDLGPHVDGSVLDMANAAIKKAEGANP